VKFRYGFRGDGKEVMNPLPFSLCNHFESWIIKVSYSKH